jgi:hypothetical protein
MYFDTLLVFWIFLLEISKICTQQAAGRGRRPCSVESLVAEAGARDYVDIEPRCNSALQQTLHDAIHQATLSESWKANHWTWNSSDVHVTVPIHMALVEGENDTGDKRKGRQCAVRPVPATWGSVHHVLNEAADLICSARRDSRASTCVLGRRHSYGSCESMNAAYAVKYRLCGVLCSMREIADAELDSCEDFAVAPPSGTEANDALVQLGGNCQED